MSYWGNKEEKHKNFSITWGYREAVNCDLRFGPEMANNMSQKMGESKWKHQHMFYKSSQSRINSQGCMILQYNRCKSLEGYGRWYLLPQGLPTYRSVKRLKFQETVIVWDPISIPAWKQWKYHDYFNLYPGNTLFQITDLRRKYWGRLQGKFFKIKLEVYDFILSTDEWTRWRIKIKLFSWIA